MYVQQGLCVHQNLKNKFFWPIYKDYQTTLFVSESYCSEERYTYTLDQAFGLVKVARLAGVPEVIGGHLVADVFVVLE